MNAVVLLLVLAQPGQVVIDVAPAVAVRTTREVSPSPFLAGNALFPVGGGVLLDAGAQVAGPLVLLGSLAGGVWGATPARQACCDAVLLDAAFSFRVGPSARVEWPTSRGTLLAQVGPPVPPARARLVILVGPRHDALPRLGGGPRARVPQHHGRAGAAGGLHRRAADVRRVPRAGLLHPPGPGGAAG
jgi:hypothetical protein